MNNPFVPENKQIIYLNDELNKKTQIHIEDLVKRAFSMESEEALRLYIHNQQLAYRLYFQEKTEVGEEILYFLEQFFSKYLDNKQLLSEKSRMQSQAYWATDQGKLINQIIHQITKDNFRILLEPILQPLSTAFTVQYRNYVLFLCNTLYTSISPNWTETDLVYFLIGCNYNSLPFTHYVMGQIREDLDHKVEEEEKKAVLSYHLKRLHEIPLCKEYALVPEYAPIKITLMEWLRFEMEDFQKNISTPKRRENSKGVPSKIETSLSVAQLGCLLHCFYEAEIIVNRTQSEMLKLASRYFKCRKTHQISHGSLHNKYYEIEDGTRQSLKQLLTIIIKQL